MSRTASILLLTLAAILFLLSLQGPHGLPQLRRLDHEISLMENSHDKLSADIAELEKQIVNLETSEHALEKVAREELALSRKGETVYIIPPPAPNPKDAQE